MKGPLGRCLAPVATRMARRGGFASSARERLEARQIGVETGERHPLAQEDLDGGSLVDRRVEAAESEANMFGGRLVPFPER